MTRSFTETADAARTRTGLEARARARIERSALRPTAADAPRQVGLELEFHLVDLARPAQRPAWDDVTALVADLPPMPSGSAVTTEPGGQLELSTPPTVGVAASVAALRADISTLRTALVAAGYGVASIGADPARPPRRVNPSPRYAAMQRHFAAVGCLEPGTAMMTATAALQVNLDAGPAEGWHDRLCHIRDLGPVLVAASACSPHLGGRQSGWASMRQQAWAGIDHGRSDPVCGDDPVQAWADYALDAPVMLVRDAAGGATAVTDRVTFRDWLRGGSSIHRPPTDDDLDYHLTTLFPPVRPRGYVEIRCLDAVPDRWWPALAALTTVLIDDPAAVEASADAARPVRDNWLAAARDGLRDPAVAAAVQECVAIAVEHAPPGLRTDLEALADLVRSGRSPGDDLRGGRDPLAILVEESRG